MVKVKICGITNLDDALLACDLGANAIGFIFYDKSPRFIKPEDAKEIVEKLPPFITTVGVFVNSPLETINEIFRSVSLNIIQLHGDEDHDYCNQVQLPVIKAIRITDGFDFNNLLGYNAFAFLLDTYHKNIYGGSGKTFNWRLAKQAKKFRRIILSGGLDSGNVPDAIEFVNPYAVDVCSGVEEYPGKKDSEKLRAFFEVISLHSTQTSI